LVPFLWGFSILECDSPFFCDEDASGIVAPSSLRFTKNEFGKPNVIWPVKRLDKWRPPSLCFNLTHTQSLLMCAVTQKAEVSLVFFFAS
jgi:hypothetical protein